MIKIFPPLNTVELHTTLSRRSGPCLTTKGEMRKRPWLDIRNQWPTALSISGDLFKANKEAFSIVFVRTVIASIAVLRTIIKTIFTSRHQSLVRPISELHHMISSTGGSQIVFISDRSFVLNMNANGMAAL